MSGLNNQREKPSPPPRAAWNPPEPEPAPTGRPVMKLNTEMAMKMNLVSASCPACGSYAREREAYWSCMGPECEWSHYGYLDEMELPL